MFQKQNSSSTFTMQTCNTMSENGNLACPLTVKATKRSLFMAGGQIVPTLSKFVAGKDKLSEIGENLIDAVHPGDFVFLALLGWASVPLCGLLFSTFDSKRKHPYNESYIYQLANHISQAARIALVVYAVDLVVVVLNTLGFTYFHVGQVSQAFAKIIYVAWASQRLSVFKRHVLSQAVSHKPDQLGRVSMIDRLADGLIYILTGFFLLDILNVEMGVGFTSVFAFGSAGTIVVGLATKDIAAMFVSGLTLTTSNRISEGDDVRFGDGTSGKVEKIGWMQTTIRNYDEMIEVVPNSILGNQRVKNVSRVKMCQIKQSLRFRYEDARKFEQLLPSILEEIKEACPKAITDGSRPFRCFWIGYREDYLEGKPNQSLSLACTFRYWCLSLSLRNYSTSLTASFVSNCSL
jgi:small-conductance mechanosensitive channel